jgi:hypothetical protein
MLFVNDSTSNLFNAKILKIDRDLDLLYVHGTVPGPKEAIVRVTDALFVRDQFDPYTRPPPFPTRTEEERAALPVEQEMEVAKNAVDPIAKALNL